MINRILRHTALAALALSASALAGCSSSDEPAPATLTDPGVMLRLKVAVASSGPSSRADLGDNDGYEDPNGELEKVKTLRVIIVNSDGKTVEHNRMVQIATDNNGTMTPVNDNLNFKVGSNDRKYIWLLANEASLTVPAGIKAGSVSEWLDGFHINTAYDGITSRFQSWNVDVYGPSSGGLVGGTTPQNTVNNSAFYGKHKPMSEMFRITTLKSITTTDKLPGNGGEQNTEDGNEQIVTRYQDAELFLTRAVSKVTFRFDFSGCNPYASSTNYTSLKGVRLSGLNTTEYVFPSEATVYSPAKYNDKDEVNVVEGNRRYIKEFSIPGSNSVVDLLLEGDKFSPLPMTGTTVVKRGPYYFAESICAANGHYTVQVNIDGNWLDAKPLTTNILNFNGHDAIARNTHLYIDIKFKEQEVTYTVIEAPYNTVTLDPIFGLNSKE